MHEAFNVGDVSSVLVDLYAGRASQAIILGNGEWSQAYGFALDGHPMVIRVGAHEADFAKDEIMAAKARALPVPTVTDRGALSDGRHFIVSERKFGTFLDDLDEIGVRRVLPDIVEALLALRDLEPVGDVYGIWTPDGAAPYLSWQAALLAIDRETERVPGWREALANFPGGMAIFQRGHARLQELASHLPEERHFIHGDLLNRNVLVSGKVLTGVLDWGNSLYGDYLYDIAWLEYWKHWYRWELIDFAGAFADQLRDRGEMLENLNQRLLAYQIHISLDAVAYNSFKRRWEDVSWNVRQLTHLCDRP